MKKKEKGKKDKRDKADKAETKAEANARQRAEQVLENAAFAGYNLKAGANTANDASVANRRRSERREPTTILDTAKKLIYMERNRTYTHPTENFENIANLFNAYFAAIIRRPGVHNTGDRSEVMLGRINAVFRINNIDVAHLNILQKVARGATNQSHEDTMIDIAGYAGCIERILKNK